MTNRTAAEIAFSQDGSCATRACAPKRLPIVSAGNMATVDSAQMRVQNSSLVLRLVWSEELISRAEVSRRTGLSRSTVSDIVGALLEGRMISEFGAGDSVGGRRPILLRVNEDAFAQIGIDIGASHVGVGLMNPYGQIKAWRERRHPAHTDPHGTFEVIDELIETVLVEADLPQRQVLGLGVAVPSPVHPRDPGLLSEVTMPAWAGRDIRNQLGQTYGVPVFVDNDANLGALAELWWGAGRDGSDLVYVKVGTGVGAGFIINGDIYRGSAGFAGEIGHVVIDPSSDRQLRGLRGCLAAFVGAEALERRAAERLGGAGQPEGTPCTVSNIAQAALHGDPIARAIVEEAGRYLGIAVVNLLNLTNPATVVLGGPITRTGEIILRPIHETVRAHTLWRDVASSRVVTSELGERAIAIGAATQVLKAALDTPSMFPRIQVRRKGSPV